MANYKVHNFSVFSLTFIISVRSYDLANILLLTQLAISPQLNNS